MAARAYAPSDAFSYLHLIVWVNKNALVVGLLFVAFLGVSSPVRFALLIVKMCEGFNISCSNVNIFIVVFSL